MTLILTFDIYDKTEAKLEKKKIECMKPLRNIEAPFRMITLMKELQLKGPESHLFCMH